MDAFSVSLANGLNDKQMKLSKSVLISGTFAFFQALMPLVGWICIHYILELFNIFEKLIPYIALILLVAIGIKMIFDGRKIEDNKSNQKLTFAGLLVQGIATSIDALSVGFTFSSYNIFMTLIAILIIAIVTFIICFAGTLIGKKFGTKLFNKSTLIGGIILILIGFEIFITGII